MPESSTYGVSADRGSLRDDLDVKMIDRHGDPNIYTFTRTSERRIGAPSLEKIWGWTGPCHTVPATILRSAVCATTLTASTTCDRERTPSCGNRETMMRS